MLVTQTPKAASNPWLAHQVRIVGITPETDNINTYRFEFTNHEQQQSYSFLPGQFNMLYLPGYGEIAIGVSTRQSSGRTWDHTIRLAGRVTHALARLKVGDSLFLRGPFGTAWPLNDHRDGDVIFIAGGTGLASLRAALYWSMEHRQHFRNLSLLYGSRTPDALLYHTEYEQWQANELSVQTTVDRDQPGWDGHVGVVTQLLDRMPIPNLAKTSVYCCGPEPMLRFVIRSATQRGIEKDQIWVSLERNMQCAVGICGHCQLGTELICRDGPVYRYDTVEKLLNIEGL